MAGYSSKINPANFFLNSSLNNIYTVNLIDCNVFSEL